MLSISYAVCTRVFPKSMRVLITSVYERVYKYICMHTLLYTYISYTHILKLNAVSDLNQLRLFGDIAKQCARKLCFLVKLN